MKAKCSQKKSKSRSNTQKMIFHSCDELLLSFFDDFAVILLQLAANMELWEKISDDAAENLKFRKESFLSILRMRLKWRKVQFHWVISEWMWNLLCNRFVIFELIFFSSFQVNSGVRLHAKMTSWRLSATHTRELQSMQQVLVELSMRVFSVHSYRASRKKVSLNLIKIFATINPRDYQSANVQSTWNHIGLRHDDLISLSCIF